MEKFVSIIYVYFNTPIEIKQSINSVLKTSGIRFEIIIVNNNSPKPLPKNLKKSVKIITNLKNLGYGKAVNQGVRIAKGEIILLANPDTIFLKDSISLMFKKITIDKKIGVIGPQLLSKEGKILHSIASMPNLPDVLFAQSFLNKLWPNNYYSRKYWAIGIDKNKEQESDTVGGAVMLMRKSIFKKIGGFDERFFLYFEEADLCKRIKLAGYKIIYLPNAKVIHFVGRRTKNKNFIKQNFEKSRFLFIEKYYGFLPALMTEAFLRGPLIVARKK